MSMLPVDLKGEIREEEKLPIEDSMIIGDLDQIDDVVYKQNQR